LDPLETYLTKLRDTHSTGAATPETAYYAALDTLFNTVGHTLKPRVTCFMGLKQQGAGLPDGGLFTVDQLRNSGGDAPISTIPARGAIEVKPAAASLKATVNSDQVRGYLRRYQQVLVTNLREFVLVTRGEDGGPQKLEDYRLGGGSAEEFWDNVVAHPRTAANLDDGGFAEFIRRVILRPAPLAAPKDVAWFLASYAREALRRIGKRELPALSAMREALEQALGIKFEGEKGEHFFRSTLVQTLFYGVFAAWVLWRRERGPSARREPFNWRLSEYSLRVPIVAALFHQVSSVSQLEELRIVEPLDWAGNVLNRVEAGPFFEAFEQHHAVQYFYEPFLQAYDPELRKQLGVWYTPPEIVTYMVERVDSVLRSELGLADGLADESVIVLDPCCGTGSYIVEVLRRIHDTMKEKGADALTANRVKTAATNRVFGFEIMPAPFVIAHLQIGLALRNAGAPLSDTAKERAGVYLTNALTGWEPPQGPKQHILALPELEVERDAADDVKRAKPVLVILGNPPYNGFAGLAVAEERDLTLAYRTTKRAAKPQGQGLNDLYVRFYRTAERKIVEGTRAGVVCLISNYSWLDGLSFTGMRERYLDAFDSIRIDCLNGDKYKTGKLTPEGKPDPSIFSAEWNREGIQVGTAIALLARRREHKPAERVWFRSLWGADKRNALLASARQPTDEQYETLSPPLELGFSFLPGTAAPNYLNWPLLPELFPVSFPGVKTSRDDFVIDIDRGRLETRIRQYLDPDTEDSEIRATMASVMISTPGFDARRTRRSLVQRGFGSENIIRYCYRPFDHRWIYWETAERLLDRPRVEFGSQIFEGNFYIEARQRQPMEKFDRGFVVKSLADNFGNGLSSFFPVLLVAVTHRDALFSSKQKSEARPNLSPAAQSFLASIRVKPGMLFYHSVAIMHAPNYRVENAATLRQDWPRIPLPNSGELLTASADLGRKIAALLDTENQVDTVTAGKLRPELAAIAPIASASSANLDPAKGHLALTAGWGHAGKGGVVMPARGQILKRDYTQAERDAIAAGAGALGLSADDATNLLGAHTCDIYLNDIAYWRNVPARVWEYTIGGYQVIKKWLSYRERELLHRDLTPDEVAEVTAMARRIAAIVLMAPALDANYQAIKANTYAWPAAETVRA